MQRRTFLRGAAVSIVVVRPRVAGGQPAERARRVGWLDLGQPENRLEPVFRRALLDRGWIEGRTIVFDSVYAHGATEQLPTLVAALLRSKAEVIVTSGTTAIRAAREATRTVPIVMAGGGDPVGAGLVQSLARPGGNVTGVSLVGAELMEKNIELVRQIVPGAKTVTMIRAAGNPANAFFFDLMNAAAQKLGIRLVSVDIHGAHDLEAGFARIDTDAAFMLLDPVFFAERRRIAEIAIKRRLLLVTAERTFAEAGIVMTHGPSMAGVIRATAVYVDKILRGAHPADLPVEQPTTLELVINRKTAKAVGLTIPAALLLRADQVIE